jgi:hypothetical protein
MSISLSIVFVALYVYRSAVSIFAQIVVSKLTKLGDAGEYQKGNYSEIYTGQIFDSTLVTRFVGYIVNTSGFTGPFFVNIIFQTIAFFGIFLLVRSVSGVYRYIFLIFFATPSFTLWSSIAGKEAIVILLVCLVLRALVKIQNGEAKIATSGLISLAALWIFKPSYFPGLLFLICIVVISSGVRQRASVSMIAALFVAALLLTFRDTIDAYSFSILPHFQGVGLSTREAYWNDPYDVFFKAPYGMFQAFFGPTVSEASRSALHMFSFVESLLILFGMSVIILVRLPTMPVYSFLTSISGIFLILFVNYPFGIMNPGSAIRYRTGYLPIILFIIIIMMSKYWYVKWFQKPESVRIHS